MSFRETLNFLVNRKRSYQLVFRSPAGREVLRDLAKFCRANQSTFHADARAAAALDGRREVYLRILQHLKLTPEELYDTFGGAYPLTAEGDEHE